MDVGCGFLNDSARNVIIELQLNNAVTYFEKTVDVSAASRTRRNASGVYFDTTTFQLADVRWYIRFYVNKLNSGGLPAVYLYMSGKNRPVVVELQFTLCLAGDLTEILTYSFGDSAKFEGFGKTLRQALVNTERLSEVTVSAEIQSVVVYKLVSVRVPRLTVARPYPRTTRLNYLPSSAATTTTTTTTLGFNSSTGSDSFQVNW